MGTATGGDEGCPVGRLFGVPVGTLAVVLTVVLAAAFGLAAVAAECLAAALDEPLALSGAPGLNGGRRDGRSPHAARCGVSVAGAPGRTLHTGAIATCPTAPLLDHRATSAWMTPGPG